ncbi:MAG: M1 family metallopeptidase [Chloroflexota bacterium]|nr:M1 family metallopeptidase [Chloroflexota bacterium]
MTDQATLEAVPLDESSYRLPKTVVPERYELTLAPDLGAFTYTGEERVAIQVREPVQEIVLNALDLDIREAYLANNAGVRLDGAVTLEPENERARIALAGRAEPGAWTLHLSFSGILNDKLHGFYRSTYRDENGNEHVIATTQMEATDARRAFPCWDEPEFKAVFAVTLVVDEDLMAISNAREISSTPVGDGKKAVRFADTMKMSTYLVAFIVGRLEATEPVDVDGTPLQIIFVPGKRNLAAFALEVGAFSLKFFAGYYGIPYPGDKLDMIALPDFASGAMENLGAITYRETALLVDTNTASHADLERVADVIAHELAHMWFGDLVTMKWWNGIWLNEAFATFMEMLAVDAFKPEWQRWASFSLGRGAAMLTDALRSTRPIEYTVRRPEECESMFDILTYEKGAAVLRMLEQYLGGEEFQRGIRLYLKSHEYANAETTDLWDAIEEATGEPTRRIMDSWIFQGGFPLVTVAPAADGKGLALSQRRFRYLASDDDAQARWQVPVMLRAGTENGVETRKLLLDQAETTVDLGAKVDWVVANERGNGFYRVRYAPELLRTLTGTLQDNLDAVERFNLVNDTWASVVAGLTPPAEFLDLARRFQDETDRNVWVAIIGALEYVNRMLPAASRPALQAYVRELIGPAVQRLGWEPQAGESELTGQLRGTLIGALGTLGEDPAVQQRACELHAAYVEDRGAVDRNVAPAVIGIVAHTGGQAEYDLFVERYKSAATPQEEQRYLFNLGNFRERGLLWRTLDMTLTPEVRTQNAPFLIGSLMTNPDGGDLAWGFVKSHWEEIVERFPDNTHVRMLAGITALSTPELASDVEQFFQTHTVKQGQKTLDQHLERLQVNVRFREREMSNLTGYFS